jgi:hypothetical protein
MVGGGGGEKIDKARQRPDRDNKFLTTMRNSDSWDSFPPPPRQQAISSPHLANAAPRAIKTLQNDKKLLFPVKFWNSTRSGCWLLATGAFLPTDGFGQWKSY